MVMNFVECEFQREQPFEKPGDKFYKEHAETVMYKEKTSNSTATVADTILSDHYKRKSNNSLIVLVPRSSTLWDRYPSSPL